MEIKSWNGHLLFYGRKYIKSVEGITHTVPCDTRNERYKTRVWFKPSIRGSRSIDLMITPQETNKLLDDIE